MTDEIQPRVWVGKWFIGTNWIWTDVWERFTDHELEPGNVFVPGTELEPTIDPAEMKTIRTCKEIDWDE